MWIFLSDAMLSIVADRDNKQNFLVRARLRGDLEHAFGSDIMVTELDWSDYAYRASIPRKRVQKTISRRLGAITYDNFKNSVKDTIKHMLYMSVWSVMLRGQDKESPRKYTWQNSLFEQHDEKQYRSIFEPRFELAAFEWSRYFSLTCGSNYRSSHHGRGIAEMIVRSKKGGRSLKKLSIDDFEELQDAAFGGARSLARRREELARVELFDEVPF